MMSDEEFEIIINPSKNEADIYAELLSSLNQQNYINFAALLKIGGSTFFDVNHFYEDPHNGTLLDIACRSKGNYRFVKILILYNAKVNVVNPKRGKAPIHEAIKCNDIQTMKILCRKSISSSECGLEYNFDRNGCNINVTDVYGRTAVMTAAYFARRDILLILLKNPDISLNAVAGKTILHSLVDGWIEIGGEEGTDDENHKYYQCLDCILKETPHDELCDLVEYLESQSTYYANEDERERNTFFKAWLEPRLEKYKIKKIQRPSMDHKQKSFKKEFHNPEVNSHSPSIQSTLLFLMKEKNLHEFESILTNSDASIVNHFYVKKKGTLLDICCRISGYSQFVDIILKHRHVDINKLNNETGKAAIHEAVQKSDEQTLRTLLRHDNCDINLIDSKGFSVLDYVAVYKKVDYIDILFDYGARKPESISISEPKAREMQKIVAQYTPIMRSARYGNYLTFKMLFQDSSVLIEPSVDGKTIIHMVLDGILASKYQKRTSRLQEKHFATGKNEFDCEKDASIVPLNFTLFPDEQPDHHRLLEYFLQRLKQLQYINYADRDGNTALHYAVAWEDKKSTEALLTAGAHTCIPNKNGTIALRSMCPSILEYHLDRCIFSNQYQHGHSDDAIVFNYCTLFSVCVNGMLGRYADADHYHYSSVDDLYDNEDLQTRFDDECIYVKGTKHMELKSLSRFGKQRSGVYQQVTQEVDPILIMHSEHKFRHLLKHPVVRSYLDIKWGIVGKYFKYNFALYFIYWLSLSVYLFYAYDPTTIDNPNYNHTCTCSNSFSSDSKTQLPNTTDSQLNKIESKKNTTSIPNYPLWRISIFIFCLLLVLRELFQAYVLPKSYFKSLENWLEIGLFVSTFILVIFQPSSTSLAAILILISWMELVLLIGRHPRFSTHIEIFKTVSLNFFKFLFFYSIMIVAFAFSFYMLFKGKCRGNGCCKPAAFPNILLSIFKTLVMLTGEFDSASIHFGDEFGLGHIFFLLFVVLISIVLLNLLHGLAVRDTQQTIEEAETVGILSRVKFIQYVESMARDDPIQCLDMLDKFSLYLCNLRYWKTPYFFLNQRKRVEFQTKISLKYRLGRYYVRIFPKTGRSDVRTVKIDRKIIDDAVQILQKTNQQQNETVDGDEYPRCMRKMTKR